jgi:hypothetical protein
MGQERMEEFLDNPDNFMPMQESILKIPNPRPFDGMAGRRRRDIGSNAI